MSTETTRTQIMQHALRLIQARGYNGFSYRDLAELVGIKTSSIHYYFPCKDDLLLAIVQQYRERWEGAIHGLDQGLSVEEKLRAYMSMHRQAFCNTDRICLATALAADLASLPGGVRKAVQDFYQANEDWIAQVLQQGVHEGVWQVPGDVRTAARSIYAALQGSLLTARLFDNSERIEDIWPAILTAHEVV